MPDVTINSDKSDMTKEDHEHNVVIGIDEAGFLCIRAHVGMGKWNLWGILDDAQNLVLGYFVNVKKQEIENRAKAQGLVRPDGILNGFRKKWHQ